MGCICGKDNVVIQGQKFNLIRQVGEGCIIEFSNDFNLVGFFSEVLVMYMKRVIQRILIGMRLRKCHVIRMKKKNEREMKWKIIRDFLIRI